MGKLTTLQIEKELPPAVVVKKKLQDGEGLFLEIRKNDRRYWRLKFHLNGKPDELPLGVYPKVSLKEARHKAAEARIKIRAGINPCEERRKNKLALKTRLGNTVGMAAEEWYLHRARAWKPKTSAQVRSYLDKDLLPAFGKRPLDSVTTEELATVSMKIERRGAPDVAKKFRQWISRIYAYARGRGWTESRPETDLRELQLLGSPAKNYPHLDIDELPAFLRKLDAVDAAPTVKGAAKLALWTANRPGVTRTLLWSEVDLDAALWTIKKGRRGMKLGYAHVSPLPRQAVEMLRGIHAYSGTFEHVFIGRNDPEKPISDGSVNGLLKRLGYGGKQTTHGFRHLISTSLNERGYNRDWIERQLAHGDPSKERETYNKAPYLEERRKMMQAWADLLDELRESSG